MKIDIKTDINLTKIYFDDILHIAFIRAKLVSIQSWRDYEKYSIELKFENNADMIMEYSDIKKWKEVLTKLENNLYP